MKIIALKCDSGKDWVDSIFSSLKQGEARFGWSYYDSTLPDTNLVRLKEKINTQGWSALTDDEKNCWQPFLLDIESDDYVVFINVPEYGKCTLAEVTQGYYWKAHQDIKRDWGWDGNHCLGVDLRSVRVFNRNGENVHPELSKRLKLRGRHWQIYAEKEFTDLLNALANGLEEESNGISLDFLRKDLSDIWKQAVSLIQKSHPGKKLENLIQKVFEAMPCVDSAKINTACYRSDHGADIIVIYTDGFKDFSGLNSQKKLVIQVKSYEGDHYSDQAVEDIKNAIVHYEANMGLIVTTGNPTEYLKHRVDMAISEINVPVSICGGSEVAQLVFRYLADQLVERN